MDKLIKLDLQMTRGTAPNVVIMGIGSNELCDKKADPDKVALSRLGSLNGIKIPLLLIRKDLWLMFLKLSISPYLRRKS